MSLLAAALASLVGISLGLLGGGGSILTVPIFVYVLGLAPKTAIASSLVVVGFTSLIGAINHWRQGNVRIGTALAFGAVAMVGTFIGARLSAFLSGGFQLILFAIVMLVAAFFMLRNSKTPSLNTNPDEPKTGRARLVIQAFGVGTLTGIVGVGGGFLIVPALALLMGIPMKQAVGTSLLVIAMNSLSGSLGYFGIVSIPWDVVLLFSAVSAVGIFVGSSLVRYVSPAVLKKGFAVFLVLVGLFILYQNRQKLMDLQAFHRIANLHQEWPA